MARWRGGVCRFAYALGVQPIASLHPSSVAYTNGAAVVMLNGEVLGAHLHAAAFVEQFRAERRRGIVSEFASILLMGDCVQISVDGGRLCRPLIICRAGRPLLRQQHVTVRPHPCPRHMFLPDLINHPWFACVPVSLAFRVTVRARRGVCRCLRHTAARDCGSMHLCQVPEHARQETQRGGAGHPSREAGIHAAGGEGGGRVSGYQRGEQRPHSHERGRLRPCHHSHGDRAFYHSWGSCRPYSLPSPQPVPSQHVPVCYGKAGLPPSRPCACLL